MADPFLAQQPNAQPHHPIYGPSTTRPETDADIMQERDDKPDKAWSYWKGSIEAALQVEKGYRKEAEEMERRYYGDDTSPFNRAEEATTAPGGKTNLAHATLETLMPVMYSQPPEPIVRRRFRGDGEEDPVDKYVAEVAQRLIAYMIDDTDYDDVMMSARDDWMIGGRGIARVRYHAELETALNAETGQEEERVASEQAFADYWHWRDFVMAPCKNWTNCRWVAYRHYWAREDVEKHLPEDVASEIVYPIQPQDGDGSAAEGNPGGDDLTEGMQEGSAHPPMGDIRPRTVVWEIWHKEERKVIWLAESYPKGLAKVEDDPYGLRDFFDCGRPIIAVARGQTMAPRAYMSYYINQLDAIDLAQRKLDSLLAKIKAVGIYPGDHDHLLAKITEGDDHKLVNVKSWLAFIQKGGKDFIQWLPIQQWVETAQILYQLLTQKKQELFEVSGINDAMRGQGDPSRTATQDRIQGRYAGLKVATKQRKMASFALDTLILLLELGAEHFDEATIAGITNLDLPWTEQEREMRSAVMPAPIDPQTGQPSGPPMPVDPTFKDPGASWETVMAKLRDDLKRSYTVSVETDSTILEDEQEDRESRIAFITAFQQFVAGMAPIVQQVPGSWPLVKSVLLFGVRGFRKARTLEHMIEDLPEDIGVGEQQGPSDQELKAAELEQKEKLAQLKAELDREILAEKNRHDSEERMKDRALQLKEAGASMKQRALEMQAESGEREKDRAEGRDKTNREFEDREMERRARGNSELVGAGLPPDYSFEDDRQQFGAVMERLAASDQQLGAILETVQGGQAALAAGQQQIAAALAALARAQSAPKRIIRENGKVIGVENGNA